MKDKENVILFGTGKNYSNYKEFLQSQYNILALCDNSIDKQGNFIDGYKIIAPTDIISFDYDKIIITPNDFDSIFEQLLGLTIPREKINNNKKFIKLFYDHQKSKTFELIPTLKSIECKNSPKYIVSLTSYGERLSATAPYAITTLLNQNIQPDKIILWVAHEDKEKIPSIMEKLVEKGLEIRFCEDIKSYKKLIPALQEFPNDYIITTDDDVYYPQNWFEQLITEHEKNPKKIICHRANGIKVDEKHNLLPYINWDFCIEPNIYFAEIFVSQEQSVPCHQ